MTRNIAILLAITLVALAIPTAAHQEIERDACMQSFSPCDPIGNHKQCTGTRDWTGGQDGLSLFDLQLGQSGVDVGVYVHAPPHDDGASGVADLDLPGVLWIEWNGFSGLQKSDWSCDDLDRGVQWETHSDQVII